MARIPRFWDSAIPIINGTGGDIVCSFSPQRGPEGPVLVLGCCISTFFYTKKPERPGYGSRSWSRTKLTGRDFRDLRACLRHHTIDQDSWSVGDTGYVSIISHMGKDIG